MKISDWLVIVAILLAPILAVQIQRWIEDYRNKKNRKEWIFRTLMATRGDPLSREHINALNMIDIEYYGDKKGAKIVTKWREYLDHLNSFPREGSEDQRKRWQETKDEILIDIIFEMSVYLQYNLERLTVKKAFYIPQAYADITLEQFVIRKGVIDILSGAKSIPMAVTRLPISEDEAKEQAELRKLMLEQYKGKAALRVKIDPGP